MKRFAIGRFPAAASATTLLATLARCGIAECAADSPTAAVAQIADTRITASVKTALLDDASLKSNGIDVDTDQGVVRLSGFVSSADDGAS